MGLHLVDRGGGGLRGDAAGGRVGLRRMRDVRKVNVLHVLLVDLVGLNTHARIYTRASRQETLGMRRDTNGTPLM